MFLSTHRGTTTLTPTARQHGATATPNNGEEISASIAQKPPQRRHLRRCLIRDVLFAQMTTLAPAALYRRFVSCRTEASLRGATRISDILSLDLVQTARTRAVNALVRSPLGPLVPDF